MRRIAEPGTNTASLKYRMSPEVKLMLRQIAAVDDRKMSGELTWLVRQRHAELDLSQRPEVTEPEV